MKTKARIFTILACFIVSIGYATEFPKLNVISLESDKALVAYSSNRPYILEISLTNRHDEIVYFRRTTEHQDTFNKVFDFSQMDEGEYTVCVNYGNMSIVRSLEVSDENISVGPSQQLFEPYFKLCGNKLNVSLFNCPQKQVHISVFQDGRCISQLKLGKELAIQKRLDLSGLEKGKYEIVLSDFFDDHSFMVEL